jgi:hypothetical protein
MWRYSRCVVREQVRVPTMTDGEQRFQESLVDSLALAEEERDKYLGISLRELIHEYKHLTLVLFKCCLLQPKVRPSARYW